MDDARRLALLDRDTGVLTLRDVGSPIDYSVLDDDEQVPRLFRAGRHLAPPKRYLPGYAEEVEAAELPDAAAAQARRGNGWVKLVGDWIDRSVGDLAPTYDDVTFKAAVARAHEEGARVAVHTFSVEALPGLLAAGVDSIEHGTGLTLDLIDEMARRGTALVPTAINIATFPEIAERAGRYPVYAARMLRLHAAVPGQWSGRRTRPGCRSTSAPTRAASPTVRWSPRCWPCTRSACRPTPCSPPDRGAPGPGWGCPAWSRGHRRT